MDAMAYVHHSSLISVTLLLILHAQHLPLRVTATWLYTLLFRNYAIDDPSRLWYLSTPYYPQKNKPCEVYLKGCRKVSKIYCLNFFLESHDSHSTHQLAKRHTQSSTQAKTTTTPWISCWPSMQVYVPKQQLMCAVKTANALRRETMKEERNNKQSLLSRLLQPNLGSILEHTNQLWINMFAFIVPSLVYNLNAEKPRLHLATS